MYDDATTAPTECRYCGSRAFWKLFDGPVQYLLMESRDGSRTGWEWNYVVRCKKCQATFNATKSRVDEKGDVIWRLGRG